MALAFLLISDLHDEEEALIRLSKVARDEKVNAVLICGDVTSTSRLFLKEVFGAFAQPLFIIPGNNEESHILEVLSEHPGYVHERHVHFKNISIIGYGFSNKTPYGTPNERTEEELQNALMKLPVNSRSIFLGHCPPYGIFDEARGKPVGSIAVRSFIEKIQPRAYVCGHVHDQAGVTLLGKTLIVKIPAACLYRYAILSDREGALSVRFGSL